MTKFVQPSGPGVRLDAGYESGDTVSQYYDNLIAKLVVWAEDREGARRRMLRALEETTIEGVATTIPAAEAILSHPDFAEGIHSTKWVEERLDLSQLHVGPGEPGGEGEAKMLRTVTAEVGNRRFEVKVWLPEGAASSGGGGAKAAPRRRSAGGAVAAGRTGSVTVPMQGTIVKVLVEVGDSVEEGQTLCMLEAMKMENEIKANAGGKVTELKVAAGDSVSGGDVVAVIE